MESSKNDYHISFFKPATDSARRNRNMVVQLILIWAVAIFGFQILLRIMEKPVPEPEYHVYMAHADAIESGMFAASELKEAARPVLSVLGKVAISPEYRAALDNAISWMAYNIADSSMKKTLIREVGDFEQLAEGVSDIGDPLYIKKKEALIPVLRDLFDLSSDDIRSKIAPLELKSSMMHTFSDENRKLCREAIELYLVHNRSVLTDTVFMGFPFHYFYTAVFLLILFVGLCLLYCVRTDMFNRRYSIED